MFLPDWDILPKGELLEPILMKNSSPLMSRKKRSVDTEDVIKRKMLLEKLEPHIQILGKGNFAGYIAYIYDNGLVVFEIFYEDEAQTRLAKEKATYIMHFTNFKELSLLSKPEIMAYIRRTDNPNVRRVYHNDTWGIRMEKIVKSVEYDPVIKREIDFLLGTLEFSKRLS